MYQECCRVKSPSIAPSSVSKMSVLKKNDCILHFYQECVYMSSEKHGDFDKHIFVISGFHLRNIGVFFKREIHVLVEIR